MTPSRRSYRLILCALLAAALYLPGLGNPALREPDEGRYAEIAREMTVSGDYVTPRNDWVRYFEKPPLVYWMMAGSMTMLGPGEMAARLPAALFTVAEVVVVAALAEMMFGATAGLLAGIVLATSPLTFGFARFATLDPALAFLLTAGLGSFYVAARTGNFRSARGRRWFLAAAVMLAFGTLAKGPVALVLGGGVGLIWLIGERRGREIFRMPWTGAIALYLAIVLPWFLIVAVRNPGFLQFFFVHEHLLRYFESTEHAWSSFFFIPIVVGGLWPWTYFLPLWPARLPRTGSVAPTARSGAVSFLAIWFVVIFLFFSIPRSKLGSYILPAIPPLAIAIGSALSSLSSIAAGKRRRIFGEFAILNAGLALVAGGALIVLRERIPHPLVTNGLAIAGALLIASAAAFALGRTSRTVWPPVLAIATGLIFAMGAAEHLRRETAGLASYRQLARSLAPHLSPGCVLASYRHHVQSLPFYTHRREAIVGHRGELAPFSHTPDARPSFIRDDAELSELWSSGRCVVLVVNRNDVRKLLPRLDPQPVAVGCEGKKIGLLNALLPPDAVDPDCAAMLGRSMDSPDSGG